MPYNTKLTYEELKELLEYNPETGKFYWRNNASQYKSGDEAGCSIKEGYVKIGVKGSKYFRSRLAFLYMMKRWPKEQIDHKNGIMSDDRWCNLREATPQENSFNRIVQNKITGLRGASLSGKLYYSYIKDKNGVKKYLGSYKTKEEAGKAYENASREIHGEFSYINR